jgi:hypothetical protein
MKKISKAQAQAEIKKIEQQESTLASKKQELQVIVNRPDKSSIIDEIKQASSETEKMNIVLKYNGLTRKEFTAMVSGISKSIPKKLSELIPFQIGHMETMLINNALNEGDRPDYTMSNTGKYFPWVEVKADEKSRSGFGFSVVDYDYDRTAADVGVRHIFKNSDLAMDAVKEFPKEYTRFFFGK